MSMTTWGRLQSKSLHGSAVNKQTYTYNIRGWLTGVSGSKFTQNLYYNTGNGVVKYKRQHQQHDLEGRQ